MGQNFLVLAAWEKGRWHVGIGDPTPMGWLTVVAYLIATIACLANWLNERRSARSDELAIPRIWLALSVLMLFLGFNKQLDIQTLFGSVARQMAIEQGWYGQRKYFQGLFIAGLILIGTTFLAMAFWSIRSRWRRYAVALVGTVFLFLFVLVRASSAHHVDVILRLEVLGLRWNWILELGGIAIVCLGAWIGDHDQRGWQSGKYWDTHRRDKENARKFVFVRGIPVATDEPLDDARDNLRA